MTPSTFPVAGKEAEDDRPMYSLERIDPREKVAVSNGRSDTVELPRNFSFLWKDEVALSSRPSSVEQIRAWKEHFNVSLVVTLTEEEPLPESWFQEVESCTNLFVPVEDYEPPTIEQIDEIIEAIEDTVLRGGSAVVHCLGGKGRTGTIAACLLLRYGRLGIRKSNSGEAPKTFEELFPRFTSFSAIEYIRSTRPGSIEVESQESCIRKYSGLLWKRAIFPESGALRDKPEAVIKQSIKSSTVPMLPAPTEDSETKNHPTRAEGLAEEEQRKAVQRAQRKAPRCIICMGLPGSGKSTFANHLAKSFPPENSWLVLNQDRLGKRECERLARTCNSKRRRVILDRCNPTESERAAWLEKLRSPHKGEVALVHFAADAETCARRIASRTGHETIPKGSRSGRRIVAEMENQLEPPTPSEKKRFGSVHVVHTFEDAEEVLRSFGARV